MINEKKMKKETSRFFSFEKGSSQKKKKVFLKIEKLILQIKNENEYNSMIKIKKYKKDNINMYI